MVQNNCSKLPVLFGYHASNLGNSHVALSLCSHWQSEGQKVRLTVPSADDHLITPWMNVTMGKIRRKLVYRLGNPSLPRKITEDAFLKLESGSPVAYLWAGLSLDVFRKIKKTGTRVVIERINCHQATSRRIQSAAYDQWNIPWKNQISDERIAEENEKLSIADSIFCPSPMVRRSMLEQGFPEEKLMATSYGWAPERFASLNLPNPKNTRPVFLFVGTLCLRKGIPLLLEAWRRANIDGELVLCGGIDPEISNNFDLSKFPNVRHIPYTRDVGMLYRQADVFVFPTLEEGGPMVTYESMAHGKTALVSEMGCRCYSPGWDQCQSSS